MEEHAPEIIALLKWLILTIGGGLLLLLGWIWRRLDKKVEALPAQISAQVTKVHDDIVVEVREIKTSVRGLEKDIRAEITQIDRRVTIAEVTCGLMHGRRRGDVASPDGNG